MLIIDVGKCNSKWYYSGHGYCWYGTQVFFHETGCHSCLYHWSVICYTDFAFWKLTFLGIIIQPWRFLTQAATFLTVLSSFGGKSPSIHHKL